MIVDADFVVGHHRANDARGAENHPVAEPAANQDRDFLVRHPAADGADGAVVSDAVPHLGAQAEAAAKQARPLSSRTGSAETPDGADFAEPATICSGNPPPYDYTLRIL